MAVAVQEEEICHTHGAWQRRGVGAQDDAGLDGRCTERLLWGSGRAQKKAHRHQKKGQPLQEVAAESSCQ